MALNDPIGPAYYDPLGTAEKTADGLFYLAGVLSVLVLLVDRDAHSTVYELLQATFAASVVCLFVSGVVIRLYFATRAQEKRAADFVSNAFIVPLIPIRSEGYYNTPAGGPYLRMGAAVLENALFTKSILGHMLPFERARAAVYVCLWVWALSYRATNLELLAIAAQALFSEQLLSRWLRTEWLRLKAERLYDDVYALFQANPTTASKEFQARVIEAVIRYETSKAQAGVSLSTRVFHKLNADLSMTWSAVTHQLGLGTSTDGDT